MHWSAHRFRRSGRDVCRWFIVCCLLGTAPFLPAADRTEAATEAGTEQLPSETELAAEIDRRLQAAWQRIGIQPAEACSDREFIRRVTLDLAGRVPRPDEVQAYLSDAPPGRRARLVDRLLDSEDHVQHLADVFDTLLMGRGNASQVAQRRQHGWREYLERFIRDDRAWDSVAGEILLARPQNDEQRGAVWFLYERHDEHQAIAEAIAPAFFGVRIECAQCHDHMSVDELKQAHYWGLVAFFNRGQNVKEQHGPRVAESAVGGFSDFANLGGHSSPNLLTWLGAETVPEERPAADAEPPEDAPELYVAAHQPGDPRVPKFSRRERFVDEVLAGHPLVAKAMVNRLWALLFARGLVHPYDEMDSQHPSSHPELLQWLAEDFAAQGFHLRRLLRGLALSQAYQLSSRRPAGVEDPASFAWYLERPLTAEQLARSIQLVVLGEFDNQAPLMGEFREQFPEVLPDASLVGIDDALFLTNNKQFDAFLQSTAVQQGLVASLCDLPSHPARVARLFDAILGRPATAEELAELSDYLSAREDRLPAALSQVTWALLCSPEFCFNH